MSIRMGKTVGALAVLAGGLLASTAQADVVLLSATYDDLAGSYSTVTQTFTAIAVDSVALKTSADVSRLVPGEGNAEFEPGFVSKPDQADFALSISVGALNFDGSRNGLGTFTSTDADGDTITGVIAGTWENLGFGFIAFNGVLSQVFVNDNGIQDGLFNGSHAGSWDLNLPAAEPYTGALVQLTLGANGFFARNFTNRATGVTAQVIPTPGTAALLGLGGLAMVTRRRGR